MIATCMSLLIEVKEFLSQTSDMKDLREVDVIFNIKMVKDGNGG